MRLATLARSTGQSEILARLEQRRLQRAQALRRACAEEHAAASRRVETAAEALAHHAAHRDQTLRAAYDDINNRTVTAATLHTLRGQEDQLRRTQDKLAAEQTDAAADLQTAETALAEAQAKLLVAVRQSAKRDRLAAQLATQWAYALDEAEEARRADDVDDRAWPAPAG